MVFVPIDEAGWREYGKWFEDEELRRRVSPPTREWFDYVRNTPGCYAWVARDDEATAVGVVQLDIDAAQTATIMLVVRPDLRGHGCGRAILRAVVQREEVAGVKSIEAGIAADNAASLRCFEAAGFVPDGAAPDADGFVRLVYTCPH